MPLFLFDGVGIFAGLEIRGGTVVAKPAVASTDFKAGKDANAVEWKKEAHKVLWREYQMQEAVNEIGVDKIVDAVDAQYVEQLYD